jgi:arylsulfatase A-like enzyme
MASRHPSIVAILADDLGYGDLSCFNPQSRIRTRRLDQLAAGGLRFTDAHASSAVCTPSRYSLLTGRYCWRTPLKMGVNWGYSPHLIEDGRTTVASLLRDAGYATACFGKWHLGMDWTGIDGRCPAEADGVEFRVPVTNGPRSFGFERFFGISASLDMPPYVYLDGESPTALPNRISGNPDFKGLWRDGPTAPDFHHIDVLPTLTRKAVEYVQSRGRSDPPFFLYFPLPAPHTPILPTAEFLGASGTNIYGDFVLQCDAAVGAIMDALEQTGQAEDTILIFASDNGCSPRAGLDELAAVGHHPSYHFRGYKADIYDGGHRIPLIVRWPAQIAPDSSSGQVVCLADLLATCAEVVGTRLPANAGEDSVSNLPIWRGKDTGPVREATVHHSMNGSFSIRRGRWKLEMCPGSGGWSDPRPGEEPPDAPPIQLYDMEADVGERSNVQDRHPAVVRELTELLSRYVLEGRSTPGAPQPNTGPRHWPQLSWLAARA